MAGIIDKIAGADNKADRSRSLNFTAGDYVLEVTELKLAESTKKIGTTYFVLKGIVREAKGEEALPVGAEPSVRFPLMNDGFLSDAKCAVAAILGVTQDYISGDILEAAFEDEGAQVIGQELYMEVDINAKGYPVIAYLPVSKKPVTMAAAE